MMSELFKTVSIVLIRCLYLTLKEGGHYFPQSEGGVPEPHFFNNDYIKNYGIYSYGVNCCQVAFLMLVKDLKRLGRSNVFRAEEGRNFERNV